MATFPIDKDFKSKLFHWASKRDTFIILNSNSEKQISKDKYSSFDFVVAVDALDEIRKLSEAKSAFGGTKNEKCFDALKDFHQKKNKMLFGFLSYDLKNEIENLRSENHDGLGFPGFYFFEPRFVFRADGEMKIDFEDESGNKSFEDISEEINNATASSDKKTAAIKIKARVSKDDYIKSVNKIKQHIQRGDIYEMNYCIEFFAEDAEINPADVYDRLNQLSPMPFSCFFRHKNFYLMCASPERFLKKVGDKIISQPIKGTARRGKTEEEDLKIKTELKNDAKEQSENVMIVDLVRNDLSRTAEKGSVEVEELFGIHTFEQLHQMISTVVSKKKDEVHFTDVIKHAFPMGSMTGAPKVRAMQLIEEFEETKRGLYSGAAGYITADGDFDFNVVIRSILYNAEKKYLSFMVGSAITANAVAEKEYEECMLKADAMIKVLSS